MQVVFRADASIDIGTGHVMRCLTLADALRARGANCRFISRAYPGNLIENIRRRGFAVNVLPIVDIEEVQQTLSVLGESVDWLVVDHYALDADWEREMRPEVGRVLVIDDLANRPHCAEVLLDQNLGRTAEDYAGLLPSTCRLCIGPTYALLRPEFAELRAASLARRAGGQIRQLLISMGGVDKDNATGAALTALQGCALPVDCKIVVVMGAHAPWREAIASQLADLPWATDLLVDVSDMAALMAASDLAIGAAGTSAWERCCVGLPTLTVVLADNQRDGAMALAEAGCIELLGEFAVGFNDMPKKLAALLMPGRLGVMQEACAGLTDGLGVERLAAELCDG